MEQSNLSTTKRFIRLLGNPLRLGIFSVLLGVILWLFLFFIGSRVSGGALLGLVLGIFILYPLALTAAQIVLLIFAGRNENLYRRGRWFDVVTIVLGVIYSLLYLSVISEVQFLEDWTETLYNASMHQPIHTDAILTVSAIAAVGFAGYLIVNFIPLKKTPPLLLCLGVSGMYLGTAVSIVWYIQVHSAGILLILLPVNCVMITVRTVINKVAEWRREPYESQKINNSRLLSWCNHALGRIAVLPVIALVLAAPLLGCLIVVLLLFGQSPDAIIKAWTETSEWTMSQMVSPPNIQSGHYLCTVAAEGHKGIVKPLRTGIRNGRQITVNRQLCIANAFEQVLEERTPRLHRAVRGFYDKYGLPVSRYIRTKGAADAVYIVMKPLEWVFLAVLYLTDLHPENRIAIQYTGKRLKDFQLKD